MRGFFFPYLGDTLYIMTLENAATAAQYSRNPEMYLSQILFHRETSILMKVTIRTRLYCVMEYFINCLDLFVRRCVEHDYHRSYQAYSAS